MRTGHQSLFQLKPAPLPQEVLQFRRRACYGFRLTSSTARECSLSSGSNRKGKLCLEHFSFKLLFLLNFLAVAPLWPQTAVHPVKADLPPADEIWYRAATQTSDSEWKYLRGAAKLQTNEMVITADEIDFNSDTSWAYARGHVHMEHYASGDILNADHAEYNIRTEEGKFYAIKGTSPSKILTSPGVLTTTNPFYFEAQWADRIKNRYVLHHGFLTDCKIPKPWWVFRSPRFDVVPGDRAVARNAFLFVHHVPVLFLPYYYRPLGHSPRQSGFLTPNVGHSTIRGYMVGGGYYWAINRSYDADYVLQYFTLRGPAHTANFRGKPNSVTDFNFNFYAVQDKGLPQQIGPPVKQGGQEFELTAKTAFWGFTGKLDYNYLSSYLFRQAFANSYTSALSSEVSSVGYLQRHFDEDIYSLNFVFRGDTLYEAATPLGTLKNDVTTRKLPEAQFFGRDQPIDQSWPVWFSFAATAGLEQREESDYLAGIYGGASACPAGAKYVPLNSTAGQCVFSLNSGAVPRVDLEPRVSTAFQFAGFTLTPSFTLGMTDYGKDYATNSTNYVPVGCGAYPTCAPGVSSYNVSIQSQNLLRKDADFVLGLHLPPIERIFIPPPWLHLGEKLKHVIEVAATYEYVTGVQQFQRTIHFDESDILSDTNQLTIELTNRIYRKDKAGKVTEFINWHIAQARYLDPTFGGAVVAGQRNEVLSVLELTPYTFLTGPRAYSPVESAITINPVTFFSLEYRTAYDPIQGHFIDHAVSGSFRKSKYAVTITDTAITSVPLLVPQANQLSFGLAYGTSTRKGWNLGGNVTYDLLIDKTLFEFVQATYNTDCCGFSFQLRRFDFGIRDESQYLFSFSLANLGTFGSMQKQDRIF